MILRAWSTDADGNKVNPEDNWEKEVDSREAATAALAENLVDTASDEFVHNALVHWFTRGKVDGLHEGKNIYWNVQIFDR
jgi:hypothetical protein